MRLLDKTLKSLIILSVLLAFGIPSYADIAQDAKIEYNKGIDFYKLSQYEQAINCFKQATQLDPNYIDAYYNLGSLLEYIGNDEDALNAFKQIILRKPDDYESVYKAAQLCKKLGDNDKAKMYLTLIPQDSIIGSQAKQLAQSMDTDIPTEKYNNQVSEGFVNSNPSNYSDGIYSDITSPTGITSDKYGNLYVAGFSDNTIYKIDPNNNKLVFIKNSKIDGPIGLVMDSNGNLYVANYNKNNVLKIDKGGEITEVITNVQNPYCMHLTDGLLFVSSQGSNSVIRYRINQ